MFSDKAIGICQSKTFFFFFSIKNMKAVVNDCRDSMQKEKEWEKKHKNYDGPKKKSINKII